MYKTKTSHMYYDGYRRSCYDRYQVDEFGNVQGILKSLWRKKEIRGLLQIKNDQRHGVHILFKQ